MMRHVMHSGLRWLWLSVAVIVLDQVTKFWVVQSLPYGYNGTEVTAFFNLVHVYNYGAAFSFLASQAGWQRWFFVCLAVVICGLILFWLGRLPRTEKWESSAYALVLGGALGNVIDRAFLGYVVDFLDFHLAGKHWPAFNVADMGICIGAGMLVVGALFLGKGKGETDVKND